MRTPVILLSLLMTGCSALPKLEQTKVVEAKVDALFDTVNALADSQAKTVEVVNQVAGSQAVLQGLTVEQQAKLDSSLEASNVAMGKATEFADSMNEKVDAAVTAAKYGGGAIGLIILRYIGHIVGGPGGAVLQGLAAAMQGRRRKDEGIDVSAT